MAMVKPTALSKVAFDATQDSIFYFNVSGGNQVTSNKITIRLQSDNSIVYTNTTTSYQFNQTVPSNTLTNGTYYNFYFNTYDTNGNESDNSNIISFYCYTTPTIAFTNILNNQIIENGTYEFDVQYTQNESELLDFVTISLYSATNQFISTSGNLYSSSTPPITFSHTFSGLENNTSYKIIATATTVNGTVVSSGKIAFNIVYTSSRLYSNLSLENKCDDGYVQINSNLIVVDGESNVDPMVYLDNTKSDIRFPQYYIKWGQGYEIAKDFEISIWMKPTWIDTFCKFYNSTMANGYSINFIREIPYGETSVKDYFELKGYANGILKVYQRSNYVNIMTTNDYVLVWIKKIGTTYTLTLQMVTKGDSSSIDWGVENSNVEYNTLTDFNWGGETYEQGMEYTLLNENIDSIFPLNRFELYGGIYDNLDVTKDTSKTISTSFPTWDYNTELNCDFNNNISGGNTDIILTQLSGIKVKRRKYGETNWLTIYEKTVSTVSDLNISIQDSYVTNNTEFQWALIPILNGEIEGNYIYTSLTTVLNGTFLSNNGTIFKLYNSVVLGNGTQNIRVGQLQPVGLKYPILIQNGRVNNYSNTLSASLYGYNFEETRKIDRNDVVQQSKDLMEFITSGKSFCLTDWNGNIYIGRANASPTISYDSNYGNGIINISLSFVEQGQYDSQSDMYKNGLIDSQG